MSLRVIEPGAYSLVVDSGREHHRAFGVSLGGAADRSAFIQGNALVGNAHSEPAIEFSLGGPTLRAEANLTCVISGAPFEATVDGHKKYARSVFELQPGQLLRIGTAEHGL